MGFFLPLLLLALLAGDIEANPGPPKVSGSQAAILSMRVFQRYFDRVSSAIQSSTDQLAKELYSKKLIGLDVMNEVLRTPGLSPASKSSILMCAVGNKIASESSDKAFKKLCSVMRTHRELESLASKMADRFEYLSLKDDLPSDDSTDEDFCTTPQEIEMAGMKPGMKAKENEHHFKESSLHSMATLPQPVFQPTSTSLPEKVQIYKNYLQSLYEKDRLPIYHKYPEHLKADHYIKLALVHKSLRKKEQKDLTSKLCGKIDKQLHEHISMNKVGYNSNETLAHRILVEGSPGIGKTTFAWELCRQWQSGHMLKEYSIMVTLPCRQKEVQQAKSLEDLVFHENKEVCKAVFEYIRDKNGKGLFLLFEGFDELPAGIPGSPLIHRLLVGNVYPSATVMVTSRPITHRNFPDAFLNSLHQHIEILGFTENDIKDYIESACSNKAMILEFENYLSLHPFIKSTMFIPLQCAVITDLYAEHWEAGEKEFAPCTFTGLYTELLKTHMMRYMSGQPVYREQVRNISSLESLPGEVKRRLLKLAKLAAGGIEKQNYIFPGEHSDHLGLMQRVETIHTGRPSAVAYCFHHLTLQEYLAAYYWSSLSLSPKKFTTLITTPELFPLRKLVTEGMKEKHESTVHHWPVLMFLAGLTQLKGIPTQVVTELFQFRRINLYSWNYFSASLCHLLFEIQNPHFLAGLFKHKRFSPTCATTLDWYIIGYCIAHSSSTATWQIHYDHNLEHKPEHIEMLIKGVSSFCCLSEQNGYIDYLKVIGGSDLPKCLKLLPALEPYINNLTVLDLRGKLPLEECAGICNILQKYYFKLTAFKLVTSSPAATCSEILSFLCCLTELEELVLGFSDSGGAQFPPQPMKKLKGIEIIASYTLALHETLIVPNCSLLQNIILKNCNITRDCTQALAAFLQSPDCCIDVFGMYCSSFGSNFDIMADALAHPKKLTNLVIVQCNIGREGCELITRTMEKNDSIDKLYLLDETIAVEGAQLLLDALSSRKHLTIWLPDLLKEDLTSTSQYHFTLVFKNLEATVYRNKYGNIDEVI